MQRSRAWRRSQNKRIQNKRIHNLISVWGNGNFGYENWLLEHKYFVQPSRLAKNDPLRNHSNSRPCGCCWDWEFPNFKDRKAPRIEDFNF